MKKINLSKKFLEKELKTKYIRQIAKENKISDSTIFTYIKKYNIKSPSVSEKNANKIIGKKFNRLKVLKIQGRNNHSQIKIQCKCDCGKIISLEKSSILSGHTKSCGCFKNDKQRNQSYYDISGSYFYKLKNNANKKGIEFNLKIKDIWDIFLLQNKVCNISGLDITFLSQTRDNEKQTASVDRIDSNIGYIKSNIQIIHKRVNFMKHNMSTQEFEYWIFTIFNHLKPNGKFDNKFKKIFCNN